MLFDRARAREVSDAKDEATGPADVDELPWGVGEEDEWAFERELEGALPIVGGREKAADEGL